SYAIRLELVTQADADSGRLGVVDAVQVFSIRTVSVHVGALGQCVGVAQAVDVLLFVVNAVVVVEISHGPRSHDLASTQRSAQADSVQVGVTAAFVHGAGGGACDAVAVATDPAITRLAETSVQLDDFEVV